QKQKLIEIINIKRKLSDARANFKDIDKNLNRTDAIDQQIRLFKAFISNLKDNQNDCAKFLCNEYEKRIKYLNEYKQHLKQNENDDKKTGKHLESNENYVLHEYLIENSKVENIEKLINELKELYNEKEKEELNKINILN
ncbi:unnamed protein product, partial [Didymodactylos carnosus]